MAEVTVRITAAWRVRWCRASAAMAARLAGPSPECLRVRADVMRGVKVQPDGWDG